MQVTLEPQTIEALVHGECADVFSALGMHPLDEGWVVRAFLPDATSVRVVERGGKARAFQPSKSMLTGCSRRESPAAASPLPTI